MPHMEVNDIFQICSLYTDSKGICWMEGKCHESSGLRGRVSTLNPSVDFELEQATLPAIEADGMLTACLGSLHHRHPLVIIGEQRQVEEWRRRIGLGGDRKLSQHSLASFIGPTILGTDNGLLKPLLDQVGEDVVAW